MRPFIESILPASSGQTMKTIVVGAGHIAKQHLGCLRTLTNVCVVGVCDLSPAMAQAAAERFGVERWSTSYSELLESTQPDVVHVATPPATHFALASEALRGGAHVFVEKPITLHTQELDELTALAKQ